MDGYDLLANSECSSGCESGWTLYLDNSFVSPYASACKGNGFERMREAEEEEDLSMVSDASSGPPHFADDDEEEEEEDVVYAHHNNCFYHAPINDAGNILRENSKMQKIMKQENRRRIRKVHHHHELQASLLDDTASSPVLDLSSNNKFGLTDHRSSPENVLDLSHEDEGYSTTHFEGRSSYQLDQFGIFNPSLSRNYLQQANQWFEGRRWQ